MQEISAVSEEKRAIKNSLLLNALKGKNRSRPPIWLMRQAGRYLPSYRALREKHTFLSLCHQPELITEITLLPIDELGVDAAILFSDILMLPEALGFKIRFLDGSGPLIENALSNTMQVDAISSLHLEDNLAYLPIAIQMLKKSLKVPLIGFAGAPFTLASYLIEGKTSRDFHKTKRWAYSHPESFQLLIDTLTDAVIRSLALQVDAGVDAVQLFDSWANCLSEAHFAQFCLQPLQKISAAMTRLQTPLIFFCRGSCFFAEKIAQCGVDAISLDFSQPVDRIRQKLPSITLQGNLDPEALFAPPEILQQSVENILSSMRQDPSYIFNLGHGILPDVSVDAVKRLVATVKEI